MNADPSGQTGNDSRPGFGGGWILAIDLGTSNTAAAVMVSGRADRLDFDSGQGSMPSVVWIDDAGSVQVGRRALDQFRIAPERLLLEPKSKLEKSRVPLGDKTYEVNKLVAAILSEVVAEARRRMSGEPARVVLTHPADWGPVREDALIEAARIAGIESPVLVEEPHAAAAHLAADLPVGSRVAVYDLGGGTFDTAVLERTDGGFSLLAKAKGNDEIGGERFDDRLMELVGRRIAAQHPEVWARIADPKNARETFERDRFRREVTRAKEALAHQPGYPLAIPGLEDETILVSRAELEEVIRGDVERSFELLNGTIAEADLSLDGLDAIFLTGGSSRLGLVEEMAREKYGEKVSPRGDPKAVVALGAVESHSRQLETGAAGPGSGTVAVPPPPPPPPEVPKPPEVPVGKQPRDPDPTQQRTDFTPRRDLPPVFPDQPGDIKIKAGQGGTKGPTDDFGKGQTATPKKPFMKRPLGIALAILAGLVVLGGITGGVIAGGVFSSDSDSGDAGPREFTASEERFITMPSVSDDFADACEPGGEEDQLVCESGGATFNVSLFETESSAESAFEDLETKDGQVGDLPVSIGDCKAPRQWDRVLTWDSETLSGGLTACYESGVAEPMGAWTERLSDDDGPMHVVTYVSTERATKESVLDALNQGWSE